MKEEKCRHGTLTPRQFLNFYKTFENLLFQIFKNIFFKLKRFIDNDKNTKSQQKKLMIYQYSDFLKFIYD